MTSLQGQMSAAGQSLLNRSSTSLWLANEIFAIVAAIVPGQAPSIGTQLENLRSKLGDKLPEIVVADQIKRALRTVDAISRKQAFTHKKQFQLEQERKDFRELALYLRTKWSVDNAHYSSLFQEGSCLLAAPHGNIATCSFGTAATNGSSAPSFGSLAAPSNPQFGPNRSMTGVSAQSFGSGTSSNGPINTAPFHSQASTTAGASASAAPFGCRPAFGNHAGQQNTILKFWISSTWM